MPSEHGGWGLTVEPVLLGLLVAPSIAGACVGLAAVLAFLARTPLKVVLVDLRRGRRLDRTRLAAMVFAGEAGLGIVLVTVAILRVPATTWWPVAAIAALVGLELWFDMRSRSRRLIPELAGAVGISGVAAIIALAGGRSGAVAGAAWLVLAARSITAIVTVRDQVGRVHGRPGHRQRLLLADVVTLGVALAAMRWEPSVTVGAVAVVVFVVVQRILDRPPLPRPVVLGLRQTGFGLAIVLALASGIIWT